MSDAAHVDPNVWGPPLWDLLFTLAFRSPLANREVLIELFSMLEKVIPCQHCRRSYTVYAKQVRPITKSQPESAALWLWTVHDMVNQKLGKIAIDFEKLQKRHQSFTLLTNDLVAVDLLALMLLVIKKDHVRRFALLLCRLTSDIAGFRLHQLLEGRIDEEPLMDTLYSCHIALAKEATLESVTREEYVKRIEQAYA